MFVGEEWNNRDDPNVVGVEVFVMWMFTAQLHGSPRSKRLFPSFG